MLELLNRLAGSKISIQETVLPIPGSVNFWHSVILDESQNPLAGGFGEEISISRKIAVAEFFERTLVKNISQNSVDSEKWKISLVPNACGFAVGFNRDSTILRSISEACERWVMSKWIDDQYFIPEISNNDVEPKLDQASLFFAQNFDSVRYFKIGTLVKVDEKLIEIDVAQTTAIKDGGVYVGYAAKLAGDKKIWQHALLESFRHLLILKNNPPQPGVFPDNRIRFFSKNAAFAFNQIDRAYKKDWPIPRISFHHCEHFDEGNFYLARTIIEGWRPWHEGPLSRFLY